MKEGKKRVYLDKVSFSVSLIAVAILIGYILMNPVTGTDMLIKIRGILNEQLGALLLWSGVICLLLCGYLIVSKYGNIRLGNKKNPFTTFKWCAMMFCACMGASLQFWSVIEWCYYYQSSPLGFAEPLSARAAEVGLTYALFHWGATPWAFYAIGTIAMAYVYYNRQSGGLKCSNVCEGVIGQKGVNGVSGKVIDIVFNICTVLGFATCLGTGMYMVADGWAEILGVTRTNLFSILVLFSIALIFITSSSLGLEKGMARVADVNAKYAIIFAIFLFIVGPINFIMNSTTNSIGTVLTHFFEMSLWTDPIQNSGFPEGWTMFYWGFWIGTAPFFWIFAAKISEGRTIKNVLTLMMTSGILGTILYFGVISNYAISYQMDGTFDMVTSLSTVGADQTITQFLRILPGGLFSLISWTVVATLFLATSIESGAFSLASNTQKGLAIGEEPSKPLRIFWCLVLTGLPIGFTLSGTPIEAVKAAGNICGIPIMLVLAFAIITLFRYMFKDYGKKSAHEIMKEFEKIEE